MALPHDTAGHYIAESVPAWHPQHFCTAVLLQCNSTAAALLSETPKSNTYEQRHSRSVSVNSRAQQCNWNLLDIVLSPVGGLGLQQKVGKTSNSSNGDEAGRACSRWDHKAAAGGQEGQQQ